MGIERIYFKTDNRLLFDFSIEQFYSCGWVLRNITYDLHAVVQDPRFVTEYEAKFAAQGLPIFRLEAYCGLSGGKRVECTHSQDEEPDTADDIYAKEKQDYKYGIAEDHRRAGSGN